MNNVEHAKSRIIRRLGLVVNEPRDIGRLRPLTDNLPRDSYIFIINDRYSGNSTFSVALAKALEGYGEAFTRASAIVGSGQRLAAAIYSPEQSSRGWTKLHWGRWVLRYGRNLPRPVDAMGRTLLDVEGANNVKRLVGKLRAAWFHWPRSAWASTKACERSNVTHVTRSANTACLLRQSFQSYQSRRDCRDRNRRHTEVSQKVMAPGATTTIRYGKQLFALANSLFRCQLVLPLAHDLSDWSVLGPPNFDDLRSRFPSPKDAPFFDQVMCLSESHRLIVNNSSLSDAVVVGYPHYRHWIGDVGARDKLVEDLSCSGENMLVAWLPNTTGSPLFDQVEQMANITPSCTIVCRPHPDWFLPERRPFLQELRRRCRTSGLLVHDAARKPAGLLLAGADLVLTDGLSSSMSALYLGKPVLIGPGELAKKYIVVAETLQLPLDDLPRALGSQVAPKRVSRFLNDGVYNEAVRAASASLRKVAFGGSRDASLDDLMGTLLTRVHGS